MSNPQYQHLAFERFINSNVRPWSEDQFTSVRDHTQAASVGKNSEACHSMEHCMSHALGGLGVVASDVLNDA